MMQTTSPQFSLNKDDFKLALFTFLCSFLGQVGVALITLSKSIPYDIVTFEHSLIGAVGTAIIATIVLFAKPNR